MQGELSLCLASHDLVRRERVVAVSSVHPATAKQPASVHVVTRRAKGRLTVFGVFASGRESHDETRGKSVVT